jgi:hypothetical protein
MHTMVMEDIHFWCWVYKGYDNVYKDPEFSSQQDVGEQVTTKVIFILFLVYFL